MTPIADTPAQDDPPLLCTPPHPAPEPVLSNETHKLGFRQGHQLSYYSTQRVHTSYGVQKYPGESSGGEEVGSENALRHTF